MESIVTCRRRTYTIQIPGEVPIEVYTEKPIGGQGAVDDIVKDLAEEYNSVVSFFSKFRLLNNPHIEITELLRPKIEDGQLNITEVMRAGVEGTKNVDTNIPLVSPEDTLPEKEEKGEQIEPGSLLDKMRGGKNARNPVDPLTRLNRMLEVPTEFTWPEYQGRLAAHDVNISSSTAKDDIYKALALRRIIIARKGRPGEHAKYSVRQKTKIQQSEYQRVIKRQRS